MVYSSISDVTWTKDANLLGTWIAKSTDNDSNGTLDILDAIIAASPTITNTPNGHSPTVIYNISASDFSGNGQTTWFGAMAYVNYLNSINYGGSNQWYLPTVANASAGSNTPNNGSAKGDELVELFYQELDSKAYPDPSYGIQDPNDDFINENSYFNLSGIDLQPMYWSRALL